MDRPSGTRETGSLCTLQFFDCFAAKANDVAPRRFSADPGIKRETNVVYQQPHLVEPMKLRVYEDLPATPIAPEPAFQLPQWGRNLASRASSRTSRLSMTKRRTTSKSIISKPLPIPDTSADLPFRRRREFTPLQLSIYVDDKRLSDLPEFDRFSFTEAGELKMPGKALIRTQSEGFLRRTDEASVEIPKRTASMFETGDINFARPDTSYSIISTSRPPSEYDALHSHPVSWASLPGIPAPKSQKPENFVAVMTPMQEEFTPEATTINVNGTDLKFPTTVPREVTPTSIQSTPDLEAQAPYPTINRGPSEASAHSRKASSRTQSHASNRTQQRISQWLQYRTHSQSTSTISSVSTTASFAEHRRKRSEFYKLGQQTQLPFPQPINATSSPPQPLNFSKSFSTPTAMPQHIRSNTESTSHTVGTSVLSSPFDDENDSARTSHDSMTTYSVVDMKSRTGTIKSVASPRGIRFVEREITLSPPLTGEIMDNTDVYLSEINGCLRSPGVGVAF